MPSHCEPWPGKTRTGPGSGVAGRTARPRPDGVAGGEGGEPGEHPFPVVADDHGAVLEHRPRRRQRPGHVGRPDCVPSCSANARPAAAPAPPAPPPYATTAPTAPHRCPASTGAPRPAAPSRPPRPPRPGRLVELGGLLQDHVRVGARDAERRHPGPPRPVHLRPVEPLGHQPHGAGAPVDVRGRLVDVQRRRERRVADRHDHLDHARDAGGALGVADVRLQRAQQQRPVLGPVAAVRGDERVGLDRVAEPGAGAVRLHRVDLGGRQPGVDQRLPDDPLLGGAVRRGHAVARAVLVDRRPPYHGEHAVAVGAGVRQPLQQDQPDPLAPAGAVRRRGERLAAPVGGQPPLPGEAGEHLRRGHHGHTAGQRQTALALPQRLDAQVDRHQRRRARRLDRHRRPFEAEGVRHPAGQHAGRAARVALRLPARGVALGGGADGRRADVHAGPAAAQGGGVETGPLEQLPGDLQQQPLLGAGRQRLARADLEEARVEPVRVGQEPAVTGVAGARVVGVGVVEPVQVPAAVGRERADRVAARGDQLPQPFGRVRPRPGSGRSSPRSRSAPAAGPPPRAGVVWCRAGPPPPA